MAPLLLLLLVLVGQVIMITGDHPLTAEAIARQVGRQAHRHKAERG